MSFTRVERIIIVVTATAVFYRIFVYGIFEKDPQAHYGVGDLIDFGLGMCVFLTSGLCGVWCFRRMVEGKIPTTDLWRSAALAMTAFAAYYFVHPVLPIIYY